MKKIVRKRKYLICMMCGSLPLSRKAVSVSWFCGCKFSKQEKLEISVWPWEHFLIKDLTLAHAL